MFDFKEIKQCFEKFKSRFLSTRKPYIINDKRDRVITGKEQRRDAQSYMRPLSEQETKDVQSALQPLADFVIGGSPPDEEMFFANSVRKNMSGMSVKKFKTMRKEKKSA